MLESDMGFSERDNARPCSFVPCLAGFARFVTPVTRRTPRVVPSGLRLTRAGGAAVQDIPKYPILLFKNQFRTIDYRSILASTFACGDSPPLEGLRRAPPHHPRAAPSWAQRVPPAPPPNTAKTARSSTTQRGVRRRSGGVPAIARPYRHANLNALRVAPSPRDPSGAASPWSVQDRGRFARARSVDMGRNPRPPRCQRGWSRTTGWGTFAHHGARSRRLKTFQRGRIASPQENLHVPTRGLGDLGLGRTLLRDDVWPRSPKHYDGSAVAGEGLRHAHRP